MNDIIHFSHVCRLWRDIILSTNSFWSTLSPRNRGPPSSISLQRSGNAPLTVGKLSLANPDVDLVIDECKRWRQVEIREVLLQRVNIARIRNKLPMLEELITDASTYLDLFSNAPKLRTLELETVDAMTSMRLPWSQLINLTLAHLSTTSMTTSTYHFALRQALQLQVATLITYGGVAEDFCESYTSTISELNIISMNYSESPPSSLLSPLTLPSLRRFKIADGTTTSTPAGFSDVTISLLRRSSCPLETLILIGLTLTSDELLMILETTPSLTSLTVEDEQKSAGAITDHFLRKLTYSPTSPILLPELIYLNLQIFGSLSAESVTSGTLLGAMESRQGHPMSANNGGVVNLKDVVLRILPDLEFDPSNMERIARLRLEGMSVDITR